MKIYDISVEITEDMQVYKMKEEKKPKFTIRANHEENGFFESSIYLDSHTGTHVDAPLHMLANGKNLSYLKLEKLIRAVKVFDLTGVKGYIEKEDLEKLDIKEKDFILLKTQNSFENVFNPEYVALGTTGAEFLASKKIDGIGIDALSVGRGASNHESHDYLLENEIIIIEGIRLGEIKEGDYNMIALPIKILTLEGVPMRVVLTQ